MAIGCITPNMAVMWLNLLVKFSERRLTSLWSLRLRYPRLTHPSSLVRISPTHKAVPPSIRTVNGICLPWAGLTVATGNGFPITTKKLALRKALVFLLERGKIPDGQGSPVTPGYGLT